MLNFSKAKIFATIIICLTAIIYCSSVFIDKESVLGSILPNEKLNLGLDLKGGSHLLIEVDFDSYHNDNIKNLTENIKILLQDELINYSISIENKTINIRFSNSNDIKKIKKAVVSNDKDLDIIASNNDLKITFSNKEIAKMRRSLISQSIEIIRRRIDENGTKEPTIQAQGQDRILLQVPGIKDSSEVKRLLGKTAKMSFHFVSDKTFTGSVTTLIDQKYSKILDDQDRVYIVERQARINGDLLTDANPTYFEGRPAVSFKFNKVGRKKFAQLTSQNIGRIFAIVLDNKVITAPRINTAINQGSGIISGNFTTQEATDLALLLRAGALPAPLEVIEERTVGPSLGQDSINSGTSAAILSLLLIAITMIVIYKKFGIIANIALAINIAIIIAILAIFNSTLTLPGIAGIALTMGMSVDANVLIFERIKEELKSKSNIFVALENGFAQAFRTILDSNLTTLVVAICLFIFGTGPVKGFAVTLSVGIVSSMFCAVVVSRIIIIYYIKYRKPKKILY